jgi:NAD-dependent dihydropyrimidine dehydrogenase PreA subunit
MIYIDGEKCTGCGACEDVCPVEAVRVSDGMARIDQGRCNECEACVEACPNEAILVVIEPAEEKAVSLRERPTPEMALAEPHRPTAPLRTRVVPVVASALAFLGREVVPRLATYLVDALDRRQSALRQAQDAAAVGPANNLAPSSSGKGGQKGRHRHRRRGK